MVAATTGRDRIQVVLPPPATARQHRELGAFARFCIARVERDLGAFAAWIVEIRPAVGGYACHLSAVDRAARIEADGTGYDGPLAMWDALCRIEQRLRERR